MPSHKLHLVPLGGLGEEPSGVGYHQGTLRSIYQCSAYFALQILKLLAGSGLSDIG
jgi:hypothetical protein